MLKSVSLHLIQVFQNRWVKPSGRGLIILIIDNKSTAVKFSFKHWLLKQSSMCFLFLGEWGEGSRGTSGKNANLMNSSSGILIGKSISKNVPSCRELLPSPTTITEPHSSPVLQPENRTIPSDGAQPHLSWGGDSTAEVGLCSSRIVKPECLWKTRLSHHLFFLLLLLLDISYSFLQ